MRKPRRRSRLCAEHDGEEITSRSGIIDSHLLDLIEYVSALEMTKVLGDLSTVHPVRKKPKTAVETYSGKLLAASGHKDVSIHVQNLAIVLLRFGNGARGSISVSQAAAAGPQGALALYRTPVCSLPTEGTSRTIHTLSVEMLVAVINNVPVSKISKPGRCHSWAAGRNRGAMRSTAPRRPSTGT